MVWSWPHELIGVVFALPAAIPTLIDPHRGIPLAVGVLPAAIIGVPAQRRRRLAILIVGSSAGLALFIGGVLAHLPTSGSALLLIVTVIAAAILAAEAPAGRIVLSCRRLPLRLGRAGAPATAAPRQPPT